MGVVYGDHVVHVDGMVVMIATLGLGLVSVGCVAFHGRLWFVEESNLVGLNYFFGNKRPTKESKRLKQSVFSRQ